MSDLWFVFVCVVFGGGGGVYVCLRPGTGPGGCLSAFWVREERGATVSVPGGESPSLWLESGASGLTSSECPVLGSMSKAGDESHRRALLVGKEFCKERLERWLLR